MEKAAGLIITGMLLGAGLLNVIKHYYIDPHTKEKTVKEFIQHPERFQMHIIYRDTIPIDITITYLQ